MRINPPRGEEAPREWLEAAIEEASRSSVPPGHWDEYIRSRAENSDGGQDQEENQYDVISDDESGQDKRLAREQNKHMMRRTADRLTKGECLECIDIACVQEHISRHHPQVQGLEDPAVQTDQSRSHRRRRKPTQDKFIQVVNVDCNHWSAIKEYVNTFHGGNSLKLERIRLTKQHVEMGTQAKSTRTAGSMRWP